MNNLAGRAAIITGASRGIGRAIALGLARAGWGVVIAAKSTSPPTSCRARFTPSPRRSKRSADRRLPIQVDVRDEVQIEAMAAKALERFGRIDLLVNNAGALYWQPMLDTPAKSFDLVMGVNARAAFLCSRAVLPAMIEQRLGAHHQHEPAAGPEMVPGRIAYSISKLGMTLLTYGLAEEVRPHNIAVNSLWPVTIIESQASINWGLGTRDSGASPTSWWIACCGWCRRSRRRSRARRCSTRTSCGPRG